jgi:hypothetical protein
MIVVTPQFDYSNQDPELFATFLDFLATRYRIDTTSVHMTGLSDGGALTWSMGTALAERFASIVPIASAGGTPDPANFVDGNGQLRTRVWAFHNRYDNSPSAPYTTSADAMKQVVMALTGLPGTSVNPLSTFVDGANRTGNVMPPNSEGAWWHWNAFANDNVIPASMAVPGDPAAAGNDLLLTLYNAGGHDAWSRTWRIPVLYDWMMASRKPAASPFGSFPNLLPLLTDGIQCEDYDLGGEGLAYHDDSAGNSGAVYRADDVDLAVTSDSDGGFEVVGLNAGEWLGYTVHVPTTGNYGLLLRAWSLAGETVTVQLNGAFLADAIVPAGGWSTVQLDGLALPGGEHQLSLHAQGSDLALNWFTFDLQLVSAASVEIIVDNSDAGLTQTVGTWGTSTGAPSYFGSNYAYNGVRGRSGQLFTFRPGNELVLPSGWYQVLLRTPAKADRAVVPVDIYHDGGVAVVPIDMTTGGGVWKDLGTYQLDVANDPRVVIRTDGTLDWVQADAVAFRSASAPLPPPPAASPPVDIETVDLTLDNTDILKVRAEGFWDSKTGGSAHLGANYLQANGGVSFTFSEDLPVSGLYEVLIRHPASAAFGTAAVTISHNGGVDNLPLDQTVLGGEWRSLGFYDFTAGVPAVVSVGSGGGPVSNLVVDALRFVGHAALPPRDIIVDNLDGAQTGTTGTWNLSASKAGFYGSNYAWASTNNAGHVFSFLPTLESIGIFTVSIRYTADAGRASNAKATVVHSGGSFDFLVDMRADGGMWVELGTFAFDPAAGQGLLLSAEGADGFVIADAVRFVETDTLPPPPLRELVVDNLDVAQTVAVGTWNTSASKSGYYGLNYAYAALGNPSQTFSFQPDLAGQGGPFEVFIRYTSDAGRDGAVPVEISHDGGTYQTTVDMRNDGGTWVSLGAFQLEPGLGHGLTLGTAGTTKFVIADAVRFVELATLPPPPPTLRDLIIDDTDPSQVASIGSWGTASSTGGYYGSGYRWIGPGAAAQFSFLPDLSVGGAGTFDVSIRYTSTSSRESAVPVTIVHSGGQEVYVVDMRTGGGDWVLLGQHDLPISGGEIRIGVAGATGYTVADAVRLREVPLGDN